MYCGRLLEGSDSTVYLGVCVLVSLAHYSSDLGEGELVPELLIPTKGLGFIQEVQSQGIVLLFTSQNGQTEQTSSHCFLVSELLNRHTFKKEL